MKKLGLLVTALICFLVVFSCKSMSFETEPEELKKGNIGYDEATKQWLGNGKSFVLNYEENLENTVSSVINKNGIFSLKIESPDECCLMLDGQTIFSSANQITDIFALENDVLVVETYSSANESGSIIKLISPSGDVIKSMNLEPPSNCSPYIRSLGCSNENMFIMFDNHLLVLDKSGVTVLSESLDLENPYLVQGGDDKIYIVERLYNNRVYSIDLEAKKIKFIFSCADGRIHSGDNIDFLLLTNSNGLYGLNNDGTANAIMLCNECNISFTGLTKVVPVGDGDYICCIADKTFRLKQVAPKEVRQKTRLTLATIGNLTVLTHSIAAFNQSNSDYYIETVDYSDGGILPYDNAIARLNTEIISGKLPDMVCFSNISPYSFIRNGLLLDLETQFKQDPSISLDDIVIRKSLEKNGGIYFIDNKFCVETLIGKKTVFGDSDGWTFNQYLNLEKTMPLESQMIYNMTKDTFLFYASSRYLRHAIDWQTGEANFDIEEFSKILEACNQIKETPENPKDLQYFDAPIEVSNDRMIAASVFVTDVWELAYIEEKAGCPLSYIGWPSFDGSNGSDVWLMEPVGILSGSNNICGCWEYIKFMLKYPDLNGSISSGEMGNYGLPVFLPLLQKRIEVVQQSEKYPVRLTDYYSDRLMSLIEEIDNVAIYDEKVMELIQAESQKYFQGRVTSEKAAETIHSKINIYLAEQYG